MKEYASLDPRMYLGKVNELNKTKDSSINVALHMLSGLRQFLIPQYIRIEEGSKYKMHTPLSEIFTLSYKTQHIYSIEMNNVIISPTTRNDRYRCFFGNEHYIWNFLSTQSKKELNNAKIIEYNEKNDSIKPLIDNSKLKKFEGTYVWLKAFLNLNHTQQETLPLLMVLSGLNIDIRKVNFLANLSIIKYIDLLKLWGINESQFTFIKNDEWATVDKLLLPSFPSFGNLYTPSVYLDQVSNFIKSKVDSKTNLKKIFISRLDSKRRSIINEGEISLFLAKYGFITVCPGEFSVMDQIKIFSNADIIIGPHGMGTANFLTCKFPKALIEIFSASFIRIAYYRMCQQKSCAYGAYIVDPLDLSSSEATNTQHSDSKIDINDFEKYLHEFRKETGINIFE